tara:strand:+ start:559 stop:1449 length:891 start_codon:yes stop_codon:yes gene_type:complete
LLSKPIKPNGDEQMYKLSGISNKETRSYYLLDKDGLSYSKLLRLGEKGDKMILKVIARSSIAPNSNSRKSFGCKLVIKDGKKTLLSKELKYNKKASNVSSLTDKKGFYFTEAGFWIEEVVLSKNLKVFIKPLKGSSDTVVRLTMEDSDVREKNSNKISTLDRQKKFDIQFLNKNLKMVSSKNWILLDNKHEQKFKVKGPKIIRIFTRSVIDDLNIPYYSVSLYEDEKWISDYMFNKESSNRDAEIVNSKSLSNSKLSKFNSFYFNVPLGTHYYSLKIPKGGLSNEVLFKIEEYDIK